MYSKARQYEEENYRLMPINEQGKEINQGFIKKIK